MKRTLLAAVLILPSLAPLAVAGDAPADAHAPKAAHGRMTWQQHFAQANTTHDGHLTLDQAQAGYPTLAKHFTEIDAGGKGFVTEDDVKAWHKLQRAAHQQPASKLRPRHAFHQGTAERPTVKASSQDVVPDATTTVGPDAPAGSGAPG
jgi:hypothetical protein